MDQLNFHKIASLTQSIKAHNYLIKLTSLLVSVSLVPFIFSSSSSSSSSSSFLVFLHYFNFYFATFPVQLFTHTIDKNCMFLLCNGLLVFVGITRSLSWSSGADESSKYIEDGSQSLYSYVEAKEPMLVVKEAQEKTNEPDEENTEEEYTIEIYSSEEVEENVENMILKEGKGSNQSALKEETRLFDEGDELEDKESEIDEFLIGESVEDVEEGNGVLSTEELNKKFDDFIRKMKEDLRIEAQKQLVMV